MTTQADYYAPTGGLMPNLGAATDSASLTTAAPMVMTPARVVVGLLALASAGVSAYHGYKRNQSVGWAVVWGLLGGMFPIITPAIALAQGFGKPRVKRNRRRRRSRRN